MRKFVIPETICKIVPWLY